jgi:hypothetical protein
MGGLLSDLFIGDAASEWLQPSSNILRGMQIIT